MKFSVDDVGQTLHRLFIQAGALRDEDKKKAQELAALLPEIARVTTGKRGVLVDACAGKSAVGLVAAALVLPPDWRVVVIERDPKRVQAAIAASAAVERRVDVVEADVSSSSLGDAPDVVVALHACGPASDAVIEQCAAAHAKHVLLVPCCYGAHPDKGDAHTIPGQAAAAAYASSLPRQGLVGRRFAQAVIDAERTLRLEEHGYAVDVVEFVSPSITPHNLLWRARRANEPVRRQDAASRRARLRGLA